VLRVGAPLSLAGVLLSVVYMWLTPYTSSFGTAALAALGVGHKVEGLGFIAISGFALSASALVGQNLGARQEARVRQAVRMTVGYCLAVTTITAVGFLTIPRTLVALFTSDAAVIADGSLYLRVIAFAQIGQTFEIILEGALAGAGYTLWPQLASTTLTLLRVPLAACGREPSASSASGSPSRSRPSRAGSSWRCSGSAAPGVAPRSDDGWPLSSRSSPTSATPTATWAR